MKIFSGIYKLSRISISCITFSDTSTGTSRNQKKKMNCSQIFKNLLNENGYNLTDLKSMIVNLALRTLVKVSMVLSRILNFSQHSASVIYSCYTFHLFCFSEFSEICYPSSSCNARGKKCLHTSTCAFSRSWTLQFC